MEPELHDFERIYAGDAKGIDEITRFLDKNNLNIDDFIEVFLVLRNGKGEIIACGGIAPGVIKCVAIDDSCRGQGIALTLASSLIRSSVRL